MSDLVAVSVAGADREEKLTAVWAGGERLLGQLDELGLSLAAAYLSMFLEMLAVDNRRVSKRQDAAD